MKKSLRRSKGATGKKFVHFCAQLMEYYHLVYLIFLHRGDPKLERPLISSVVFILFAFANYKKIRNSKIASYMPDNVKRMPYS